MFGVIGGARNGFDELWMRLLPISVTWRNSLIEQSQDNPMDRSAATLDRILFGLGQPAANALDLRRIDDLSAPRDHPGANQLFARSSASTRAKQPYRPGRPPRSRPENDNCPPISTRNPWKLMTGIGRPSGSPDAGRRSFVSFRKPGCPAIIDPARPPTAIGDFSQKSRYFLNASSPLEQRQSIRKQPI
jgi:hypothetical protein